MKEAIQLIRKDLGDEAVIVNQQLVSEGWFGFLKKKKLEVTVAIEDKVTKKAEPQEIQHSRSKKPLKTNVLQETIMNQVAFTTTEVQDLMRPQSESTVKPQEDPSQFKPEFKIEQQDQAAIGAARTLQEKSLEFKPRIVNKQPEHLAALERHEDLKPQEKSEFKPRILNKQEQLASKSKVALKSQEVSMQQKVPYQEGTKQHLESELSTIKTMIENMATHSKPFVDVNQQLSQAIANQLADFDFSDEFTAAWQQALVAEKSSYREVSTESLYDFIKHEVSRLVSIGNDPKSKIQIFVGPPGVGKTTTIAKIASNEMMYHQRKVGLITVDTYRIGAVEQLKTYASILNIPIKVVYNQADMAQAIEELQDCDRIIIDSVGRTHRDQENLAELKKLFEPIEQYNCYLVLSMSMKYRQLARIMEQYQCLNYNHLVLTKLDESERNENILNICYQQSYPITYLCTGQEVPTDIEIPSSKRILELIWGGVYHG